MYGIYRSNYRTEKEYRQAIEQARRSAEKVVKVEGGYMVFATAEDYRIWAQQK